MALHYPKEKFRRAYFEIENNEIEIQGSNQLVRWTISRCDGKTSIIKALDELSRRKQKQVRELLVELIKLKIVHTTHDLPYELHRLTSNAHPLMAYTLQSRDVAEIVERSRFSHTSKVESFESFEKPDIEKSPLLQLISRRASLTSTPPVAECTNIETLINVSRAGYGNVGTSRKTVPSSGALWPMTLFCAEPTRRDGRQFRLWWYDDSRDVAGLISITPREELLKCFTRAPFLVEDLLATGSGVIFAVVDLSRLAAKYGSRAYRFALIETGAACQNMQLFATEQGLTSRIYGGVIEQNIEQILQLPDQCIAICALVIGKARP